MWKDVPERFKGWQFTQTYGGRTALIRFRPDKDGTVFFATAERFTYIVTQDWQRVPDCSFYYTDGGHTRMAVYSRECHAGETVKVPQGNWTGGILLAPRLEMGERVEVLYPPPGVVIDKSPDPQHLYVGSPSIAILPGGSYVASHDWFGPATTGDTTEVFGSKDQGRTWSKLSEIKGQFWSTLFVHHGKLYIIGTDGQYGRTVIRRSDDGGHTWTSPDSPQTGCLLPERKYHCAPVPVISYKGRLWRAMEDRFGNEGWGRHFRAFMMGVPEDADLLNAANWTFSTRLQFDRAWHDSPKVGWLEGNAVVTPDGQLIDMLRFQCREGETAAIVHVSPDGRTVSFDPKTGLVPMPGGLSKFTIRFDPVTKRYWSLVNKGKNPQAVRNVLVLIFHGPEELARGQRAAGAPLPRQPCVPVRGLAVRGR